MTTPFNPNAAAVPFNPRTAEYFESQAIVTNADRIRPAEVAAPAADVITEERAELAGIAPAFDTVDQVDISDLPRLRSLVHELPSARFVIKAKLAEVAALAPEGLGDGEEAFDVSTAAETLTGVSDLITAAEDFLINCAAASPEAMTEWLRGKDETALMAAFSHAAEALGK